MEARDLQQLLDTVRALTEQIEGLLARLKLDEQQRNTNPYPAGRLTRQA